MADESVLKMEFDNVLLVFSYVWDIQFDPLSTMRRVEKLRWNVLGIFFHIEYKSFHWLLYQIWKNIHRLPFLLYHPYKIYLRCFLLEVWHKHFYRDLSNFACVKFYSDEVPIKLWISRNKKITNCIQPLPLTVQHNLNLSVLFQGVTLW